MAALYQKILNRVLRVSNLIKCAFSSDVVIVFQMGKVGSTSLYKSIASQSSCPVFQIHRFDLSKNDFVNRGYIRTFFRSVWAKILLLVISKKNIKLICPVREFISRNVSDYFQTLDFYVTKYDLNVADSDSLSDAFYWYYPHFSFDSWFENQLKGVFGIDVYSKKLGGEKISFYKSSTDFRAEACVFKIEDLNDVVELVGDFLNIDSFVVSNENEGVDKWYRQHYKEFKLNQPSEQYKELLQSTKTYRHFYND